MATDAEYKAVYLETWRWIEKMLLLVPEEFRDAHLGLAKAEVIEAYFADLIIAANPPGPRPNLPPPSLPGDLARKATP